MAAGYVIPIIIDATDSKKGAAQVEAALRKVEGAGGKAEKSFSKMERSMARAGRMMKQVALAAVALAAALGVAVLKSVVSIGVQFEQLRAQLKTVEGGVDGAAAAFQKIKEFAKSTPFEVSRITEAWINLRGVGLAPTMEQFEALGNLAAARGRDITEASMAVSGAIFGETERLKAFGISAKISGEQITLSYKGASTTVKRSADEVLRAITKISNDNFSTAMEDQANTVAGAWSNVKDAYANLADLIFSSGLGEFLTKFLRNLAKQINDIPKNWVSFKVSWIDLWTHVKVTLIQAAQDILKQLTDILIQMQNFETFANKFRVVDRDDFSGFIADLTRARSGMEGLKTEAEDLANAQIDKILSDAAQGAKELKEELQSIPKDIAEKLTPEEIKLKIEGILTSAQQVKDVIAGIAQEKIESTIELDVEQVEPVIIDLVANAASMSGQGGGGNGQAANVTGAALGGMRELLNAMDGLDRGTRTMANAFLDLGQAMASGATDAGDWVMFIVQLLMSFEQMKSDAHQKEVRRLRELNQAINDLDDAFNDLGAALRDVEEKYDKLSQTLNENNVIVFETIETRGHLNDLLVEHNQQSEKLIDIEKKRRQEIDATVREFQQRAREGLVGLIEGLQVYLKDSKLAEDLQRLRIEAEIANFYIQIDILRTLGILSEDLLGYLGGLVDRVAEGLRSGDLKLGGRRGGGGRGRGPRGPSPRDTLQEMLEAAREFAGIVDDEVGEMLAHFETMRAHVETMRMSERERRDLVKEITALEKQAAEEQALTLLESIFTQTGNAEALAELERIRFEQAKMATLLQINALLLSGTLSQKMANWLREAGEELVGMEFPPEIPEDVQSSWQDAIDALSAFGEQASEAERLREAWEAARTAAWETATSSENLAALMLEAFEMASEAAEKMALSMIDSLARAVGSEEDMKRIATLRHFLEVQSYRTQAALLEPLLDPETFAWLTSLIDQFELMDPTAGIGGVSAGGGGGIPAAIDDQTNRLEQALARLGDLMGDLMTGSLSPLTPEQQYQYLLGEYNRLQGLARSGDVDAMERLPDVIRELLGAGQAFLGGTATTAYGALFSQIMGDLSAITGLSNPLGALGGFGSATSELGGDIIGSFNAFAQSQESSADQAHNDSTELRQSVNEMSSRLDLVLAQLPATGSG